MNSLAPFDPDRAREQIRQVYRDQLTAQEIHELQESLAQQAQDWEEYLADPQSPQELSNNEADVILQNILRELSPQPQSSSTSSLPSFWSGWFSDWKHWLLVPTTLACLVILWPWLPSPTSQTHPQWTGKKNGSSSHAFLQITLERTQKNSVHKRPFEENGFYELGDIFYFRFLVIEKGYIYLLRQDNKGQLEQLYPFAKEKHQLLKAGHHVLQLQEKPVPYVLEQDILGYQTLMLIHTQQPTVWPKQLKNLNLQQQQWVQHADHVHFTVLPQNRATPSPKP